MKSFVSRKTPYGGRLEIISLFLKRTNFGGKALIVSLTFLVASYTFVVLFGEILFLHHLSRSEWCESYDPKYDPFNYDVKPDPLESEILNPDHIDDPCRYERIPQLFWLTEEECDMSRRMLMSVILGGAIGYERRASDKPAGIRTMGLLSLGSCFFTISSIEAFTSSTMGWDSSRVTAAIPSGVGFLGGGLIWKGTVGIGDDEVHQVYGLTTAASAWLSAAVGVGCGGALYFPAVYATTLILMILRFGPKLYLLDDSDSIDDEEDDDFSLTEDELSADGKQYDKTYETFENERMEMDDLYPVDEGDGSKRPLASLNAPGEEFGQKSVAFNTMVEEMDGKRKKLLSPSKHVPSFHS